jgi:hypothetical protein
MQPLAWAGIVAVEKASASAAHLRIILIGKTSLSGVILDPMFFDYYLNS